LILKILIICVRNPNINMHWINAQKDEIIYYNYLSENSSMAYNSWISIQKDMWISSCFLIQSAKNYGRVTTISFLVGFFLSIRKLSSMNKPQPLDPHGGRGILTWVHVLPLSFSLSFLSIACTSTTKVLNLVGGEIHAWKQR